MNDHDPESRPLRTNADLVLRSPPNWMAVTLFGVLCFLHYTMSLLAFVHGRWEGYLSAILGTMFLLLAIASRKANTEISILPSRKKIELRSGIGRLRTHREIRFDEVRSVRLTLYGSQKHREMLLQIICDLEDIECPPTSIPQQQALWLAMTMNVPLMKVLGDGSNFTTERLESIHYM